VDIQGIRYVLAIAKYGSFSEAAYEVSLSQSSISKHLQKIEDELGGVKLFDRSTRNVRLTAAGQEFLIHASKIVADFDELHAAMRRQKSVLTGSIRVGTIPIVGSLGLASCIAGFNRKYPEIQVAIQEGKTLELLERLYSAEIDVAFVIMPDESTVRSLELHPIVEDELVLVVDVLHPFAHKKTIKLKDAANERFILPDANSSMFKMSMEACRRAGFTPDIAYQCGQVELILGLVAERTGVTIMAKKVADSSPLPYTIAVPIRPKIKRTTFLAVSEHAGTMQPVRAFIEHLHHDDFGKMTRLTPNK